MGRGLPRSAAVLASIAGGGAVVHFSVHQCTGFGAFHCTPCTGKPLQLLASIALPHQQAHDAVRLSISREVWFGIGPMLWDFMWKPIFEKRLSFCISGCSGEGRSLHVRSYDPAIVHASKFSYDPTILQQSNRHNMIAGLLVWLYQFTLLPRSPGGANLSISVSPHIDTSGSIGFDDVQRAHLEDRWLIALDELDKQSLSVDEDIDATEGQFFYETVDLASCAKYLDQVANPDNFEFDDECQFVDLNEQLWPGDEEREAWYQASSPWGWPMARVVAPIGSIARAIEQNLLQGDFDERLDKVFFKTVANKVQAASEYYQQVLQNREDRIARLMDSWRDA